MTEHTNQDPIFAAIERHREVSAQLAAAMAVSTKLMNGPEFEAADTVSRTRAEDLEACGASLIRSEPTTLAGAIALTRYVASLGEWQMPTDDPHAEEAPRDLSDDWRRKVLLTTLANALDKISAKEQVITRAPG
ncbi:hypothetical protein [Bradyrhizobium japonicum]|nr:hypothetical protein [Bradyrhizobium japonicum]